jgi:isopentenyldiphosphate isomerase
MTEEIFPIVNEQGETIGSATRKECHSGSFLLHQVVHLHVFNEKGELYLQKRNETKDIQPGKWDTAVGGHVNLNEKVEDALYRETDEELHISGFVPVFAFRYVFRSEVEQELVNSYYTRYSGEINPDKSEISEGRYWKPEEIKSAIGKNIFTPNFESEFPKLIEVLIQKNN